MFFLFSSSNMGSFIAIGIFILFLVAVIGLSILRGILKAKKLIKKTQNLQLNAQDDLVINGFTASRTYDFFNFKKYKNVSYQFFVDDASKRLAIFSYRKKELTYYTFSEMKSFEVFLNGESLGTTIPKHIDQDTVKEFKIVIQTSNANDPVYRIKLFRKGKQNIFSGEDAVQFTRSVVDTLNDIIS